MEQPAACAQRTSRGSKRCYMPIVLKHGTGPATVWRVTDSKGLHDTRRTCLRSVFMNTRSKASKISPGVLPRP